LTNQLWPVKPGGVLDRSNTQSSSLHPVLSSRVAANHKVYEVQLHHNLFTTLPDSLTFFADTLSALSLAHNQLVGETYLIEALELPALKELNLVSNHITSLGPLIAYLRAPQLQKLDLSCNRVAALPPGTLRDVFPDLTVLLMANNHLAELEPDAIRGIRIVDVGNNDIAHLNPRLGLLGGSGGLERLEVGGNRFRVPRWSVVERGTEATLRWLRGRVPVAEMGAWKGEDGDEQDTSLADLD
jgi:Leucine-rich repeat (LRR) protein